MRIVSLCPSLTELVFDLGRGDRLVGRTRYCVRPAEGVAEVPALGGTKNPLIDELLALEPSLVLLNEEENRLRDAEVLTAAGIPYLSSLPKDIPSTMAMVLSLGEALEADEAAAFIVQRIEDEERRTRAAAVPGEAPPVAYLIWRKPWMAAGGGTYIDALLSTAGARNVFAERRERYPQIQAEELRRARPRAVLLSSEPFPFSDRHIRELAEATGLATRRFLPVDGQALSWHGSRTIEGLAYARRLMRRLPVTEAAPEARRGHCP